MSRRLQSSSTSQSRPAPEGQELASGYRNDLQYYPSSRSFRNNAGGFAAATVDTGLSDDTFTDSQSYHEYYSGSNRHGDNRRSYSDESGSTRIPIHYDLDEESASRRLSRNTFSSERSRRNFSNRQREFASVHKDMRRVYPQQFVEGGARVYQELSQPIMSESTGTTQRRAPVSRMSQTSASSGVTSAIVDGCGGKCQTFENVCYFFLQLVFMMGILIGISLCIAGLVLRKSAARNLQVLVYIGILLAVVSGVLLGIQWNARTAAKRRKQGVRNAKRAPILMETLHPRVQQQQPFLAVQEGGRVVPQVVPVEQQGIPWWRRKDLT